MTADRFAPSPTGLLHLGHAYSAWLGFTAAREAGGKFLLRLEDLDTARVRAEFVEAIEEDLTWLGIDWDGPILRQSDRTDAYAQAIADLTGMTLTYTCICSRRDIAGAASAPHGIEGPVYPGTCRTANHAPGENTALRLNLARAIDHLGGEMELAKLTFQEIGDGPGRESGPQFLSASQLMSSTGDIVLSRRDGAVSYNLAVVVDDAFQAVTQVTRGADLFAMTPIQRLLQALLGLPTPVYNHHRLITDDTGKRLAKRDDARAIATYRANGITPEGVLALARTKDLRA